MKHFAKTLALCAVMSLGVSAICAADTTPTVTITPASTEQAASAQAAAPARAVDQNVVDWFDDAAGEWYSTKGELTMTIAGDTINGNVVTDPQNCTYGYPRTGSFTIHENGGTRNVKMDLMGHKSHQYLIVDSTALRRSLHADHYETLGSAYLGMTKEDLVAAYGNPDSTSTDQGSDVWTYNSHHLTAYLQGGIVIGLRAYKDSDLKFAKSGLSAANTAEEYAKAYSLDTTPVVPADSGSVSKAYKLPQGEYLRFGQDFVQLSI